MIHLAPGMTGKTSAHSAELLNQLCGRGKPSRVLMVVGHPDDEIIGAGVRLRSLREEVIIVHVTDGAPRDGRDALQAGFSSASQYANARRKEFLAACQLIGVAGEQTIQLGFQDQSVVEHVAELAEQLAATIERFEPDLVLTQPYEGGHPDHDAIALSCNIATRQTKIQLLEMSSYHLGPEGLHSGDFLPADTPARFVSLTPDERALKQTLFACFQTQQHVLRWFRTDVEAFRVAPDYDFTRPPHPGILFYEQFKFGMTWREWCAHADAALQHLAIA